MKKEMQQGIGRREFLVMTSGTALAAIAMGQVVKLPGSSGTASRNYALGYAEADAYQRVAPDRFEPNVMSVNSIASSDGSLIRSGVRVSIRGYNVEPKSPTGRDSIELITNYVADGPPQGLVCPFIAWSYTKESGAGGPVSYTVPLDDDQRLHLLFASQLPGAKTNAAAAAGSSLVSRRNMLSLADSNGVDPDAITLSIQSGDGYPKLRRGFYILTPIGGGVSEPDWNSLQLRQTDNAFKLFAMNGFDPAPARFEYLILLLHSVGKVVRVPADRSRGDH